MVRTSHIHHKWSPNGWESMMSVSNDPMMMMMMMMILPLPDSRSSRSQKEPLNQNFVTQQVEQDFSSQNSN